jgi:hypothetical protein
MSVRKRSWGCRTKQKEVIIINQEKIEKTLQLAAEAKKREVVLKESTIEGTGESDLQYPELMSNDTLIAALKRIQVPIPVYPDGSPSRERLLYLFKTNVMPRPQRSRRKRLRGSQSNHGVEDKGDIAMEVDDWSESGPQSRSKAELQRKRYSSQYFVDILSCITICLLGNLQ